MLYFVWEIKQGIAYTFFIYKIRNQRKNRRNTEVKKEEIRNVTTQAEGKGESPFDSH